jgi:trimeric autotransporter adhesin
MLASGDRPEAPRRKLLPLAVINENVICASGVSESTKSLGASDAELRKLKLRIHQLTLRNSELEDSADKSQALSERSQFLSDEVQALRSKLFTLQREHSCMQASSTEAKQLQGQLAAANAALTDLRDELQCTKDLNYQLQSELSSMRNAADDKDRPGSATAAALQQLQQLAEQLATAAAALPTRPVRSAAGAAATEAFASSLKALWQQALGCDGPDLQSLQCSVAAAAKPAAAAAARGAGRTAKDIVVAERGKVGEDADSNISSSSNSSNSISSSITGGTAAARRRVAAAKAAPRSTAAAAKLATAAPQVHNTVPHLSSTALSAAPYSDTEADAAYSAAAAYELDPSLVEEVAMPSDDDSCGLLVMSSELFDTTAADVSAATSVLPGTESRCQRSRAPVAAATAAMAAVGMPDNAAAVEVDNVREGAVDAVAAMVVSSSSSCRSGSSSSSGISQRDRAARRRSTRLAGKGRSLLDDDDDDSAADTYTKLTTDGKQHVQSEVSSSSSSSGNVSSAVVIKAGKKSANMLAAVPQAQLAGSCKPAPLKRRLAPTTAMLNTAASGAVSSAVSTSSSSAKSVTSMISSSSDSALSLSEAVPLKPLSLAATSLLTVQHVADCAAACFAQQHAPGCVSTAVLAAAQALAQLEVGESVMLARHSVGQRALPLLQALVAAEACCVVGEGDSSSSASSSSSGTSSGRSSPVPYIAGAAAVTTLAASASSGSGGTAAAAAGPVRVKFCCYDLSAVMMPVDSKPGSVRSVEHCSELLQAAVHEANSLWDEVASGTTVLGMRAFLRALLTLAGSEDVSSNSSSNSSNVSSRRSSVTPAEALQQSAQLVRTVQSACVAGGTAAAPLYIKRCAAFYLRELRCLGWQTATLGVTSAPRSCTPLPALRQRLVCFISSALRFHMRRLLNPPPPALTVASVMARSSISTSSGRNDGVSVRSSVYKLLQLVPAEGGSASGAAIDGALSSVLSQALAVLAGHSHTKAAADLAAAEQYMTALAAAPSVAATAVAALQQQQSSRPRAAAASTAVQPVDAAALSSAQAAVRAEFQQLCEHFERAAAAAAAANARTFVTAVLTWPGVQSAVQAAGGWASVQRLARHLSTTVTIDGTTSTASVTDSCGGSVGTGDDAHLALLADVQALLCELQSSAEWCAAAEHSSSSSSSSRSAAVLSALEKALLKRCVAAGEALPKLRLFVRDVRLSAAFPTLAAPSKEQQQQYDAHGAAIAM